jgi:inosose dehydratase
MLFHKEQTMPCHVIPGTAPCSWGVWYADGTPSGTPWNIFLDQAAEAGYSSLELGPDGYLPADLSRLREELEKRKLDVCAGTACYRFDQYEDFSGFRSRAAALCERIRSLGASWLVTMDESDVGTFSEKKKDYTPALWKKYFEMFKALGRFTREEFGIETVFHPHIRSLIETEDEIRRMMDYCDLRLCFDTGHHAYVNGGAGAAMHDHSAGTAIRDRSAVDFIKNHASRIAYLHFKNVDGAVRQKVLEAGLDSSAAFDMDVMCDLDRGIIDFMELRETLDHIGFSGVGIIEMDMPRATTEQAFRAAGKNLAFLKTVGLIA